MTETAVVWFRRDLRVHDNDALRAAASAERVLPVYCFDPRHYGHRPFGGADSFAYEKTGAHRAAFRRESVRDLRQSLRDRGSDLVVRHGLPEEVVPSLAAAVGADAVCFHTRPTSEEEAVESAVAAALSAADVATERRWGHTLYHPDDLPTSLGAVSDTYTPFRKAVEADATVREPAPAPDLPPLPEATPPAGDVPSLATLDDRLADPPADDRGVLDFVGGESAGLDRVETYVWERDRLRSYKETRNGLVGADYSSKFSPWLNEGCLSPRRIHGEVKRYEERRVANESTYWLVFELLWRDFFQFQFAKHGDLFFSPGGIRERDEIDWQTDDAKFDRWCRGQTGVPFVDANVRELNRTGYMSNRGRQNVASFLANDLRLDWRRGAAYFETRLVDYDPCSNYGNWAYVAGVGNDSRDRSFDVRWQAEQYDPDAEYVARWVPELADLPAEYAREPWRLTADEQASFGVELGADYPEPMVDPDSL
jgi:deoxyribodipyrimidine photo-lyase